MRQRSEVGGSVVGRREVSGRSSEVRGRRSEVGASVGRCVGGSVRRWVGVGETGTGSNQDDSCLSPFRKTMRPSTIDRPNPSTASEEIEGRSDSRCPWVRLGSPDLPIGETGTGSNQDDSCLSPFRKTMRPSTNQSPNAIDCVKIEWRRSDSRCPWVRLGSPDLPSANRVRQLPGKSRERSIRSAPPASSRRPLAMIWAVAWFAAKGVFQCAECKSLTEAQRHRARSQSLKADRSIPVPAASRAVDGRGSKRKQSQAYITTFSQSAWP